MRPQTPLKQSIEQLRGQIQALQKISRLGGLTPQMNAAAMGQMV